MPTDPVCGMFVPETSTLFAEVDGTKYYFCSKTCLNRFTAPELETEKLRKRLILGWSLSIPIIIVTFLLSFQYRNFVLLALATPVQFYSGYDFYIGAYHSIRQKTSNMDLLVTLGTVIAFIFSFAITVKPALIPGSPVFFDASSFIITMILTGNYIETATKKSAGSASAKLLEMIPSTSRLVREDGSEESISTGDLKAGDTVSVRAGEIFAVDGKVASGTSEVDESAITGEQEPVLKEEGSSVLSGTMNLNGVLNVTVQKSGDNSTIRMIHDLLEKASFGRSKVQRIADVFSSVFVPVVLTVAVSSSIFWLLYLGAGTTEGIEISVLAFVSIVVIACPCAIGLAGPVTFLVSSLASSKKGIVIRNPGAFDRAVRVTRVIFDKTGTLTEPVPSIKEVRATSSIPEDGVISYAASVEKHSNHPVAVGIVKFAEDEKLELSQAKDVKELPGKGISGSVNGRIVQVERTSAGKASSISVLVDGEVVGEITLSYRIRESAKEALKDLKGCGLKTAIVTGDAENEAKRIADELGINDVHWGASPSEKSEIIKKYQIDGDYVLFVGDGINDSVAVEVADVGVAMGSGTDIARESGDFILMNNDLRNILKCITIGEKTLAKVKQNLGWAVGYNSILIPVGAGALVPALGVGVFTVMPMFSSVAMGMSSTSVVISSLLLRKKLDEV